MSVDLVEQHTAQSNEVVVHQAVNGLELAANVEVLSGVVEVLDGRVSNVAVLVEDIAGLLLPAQCISLRLPPQKNGMAHLSGL